MNLLFPYSAIMGAALGTPAAKEKKRLQDLQDSCGCSFPGSDHAPSDRKNWMAGLNPEKLYINKIVWPGTHNSGTHDIGIPFITRPFAQCQLLSIYQQLVLGTRLLDIRVNQNRTVCHEPITGYDIHVVINDVKRFISETQSEIIILEIRTEFGYNDPPDFEKYLKKQLGEYFIHQNDQVFNKTVAQILPKRIICVWKPRNSDPPKAGSPFWSSGYLKDDWTNTDLPSTKFESNLNFLGQQQPIGSRKYFYKVENTLTAQKPDGPDFLTKNIQEYTVNHVTDRIRGYARLFIAQCCSRNIVDQLQVLSTAFIDGDFVDACVSLTWARVQGE